MLFSISAQLTPFFNPIKEVKKAITIMATWVAPDNESLPKMPITVPISVINIKLTSIASKRLNGLFIMF
jgi:hypothetical protein